MKSEISNLKPRSNAAGRLRNRGFRWLAATLLLLPAIAGRSEITEPDNLIYGVIQLGLTPVTASHTNVVVEARKTANGPVVSSYRMGESALAGNFYSIRIPLEAFNPILDTNASRIGAAVYLSVRDESGPRVNRTTTISGRGRLVRLDFTQPDSDGDGLPDDWEQNYFGSSTAGDPNADQHRHAGVQRLNVLEQLQAVRAGLPAHGEVRLAIEGFRLPMPSR